MSIDEVDWFSVSYLPNNEEIGRIGLVLEEWCTNHVVVQCRHSYPGLDSSQLQERSVIGRLKDERGPELPLDIA